MTYALTRYKSYQEYLDDESLSSEGNYRLLSTGELIEVSEEDDLNRRLALRLLKSLLFAVEDALSECICIGNKELQVKPVGDRRVNRKPDVMVLRPEHLTVARQAVLLEMLPPLFVAEVVSPGGENSDNYKRDYVWKLQQYEEMGIPEYWIIDPHREKVTLLTLVDGTYIGREYVASERIVSKIFPTLSLNIRDLLRR
ncbi:MAG: Uma2 family endonuclease [Cyanobacteria bacterium J06581_3]